VTTEIRYDYRDAKNGLYLAGRGFSNVHKFDLDNPLNTEQMLQEAGLDWDVIQVPIYTRPTGGNFEQVPEKVANVRADTHQVLGVVGTGYEPLQNRTGFDFADELIMNGEGKWLGATGVDRGRIVTALMQLDRDVRIAGLEDERILPLIAFRNGHDGGTGVSMSVAPFRCACLNGMMIPLPGATRSWKARHSSMVTARLTEARQALEISWTYYDELEELGNRLVAKKMSAGQFGKFLDRLIPYTPKMEADPGGRSAKSREEAVGTIQSLFLNSPNLENVRGTKWAALQAVAEYEDWIKPTKSTKRSTADENRFRRVSNPSGVKDRALVLLEA
jgi:phage/plasmid-like protein (TIGR03299 family)